MNENARKGPERIRSTIKGSIQVAIWATNITLIKGFKRRDSDEWENKEINLYPEEIDAAIEVLTEARGRFPADAGDRNDRRAAPAERSDSRGNERFRR